MRILRVSAIIIGSVTAILNLGACESDDSEECCTYNDVIYQYGGGTFTALACEDGLIRFTYSYTDGTTYTYNNSWNQYYNSWGETRQTFVDYGGSCN